MDGSIEEIQTVNMLKGKIVTIPKPDKTLSKEGVPADAKTVGDALAARVRAVDIVNDLVSDSIDKPLSAAQGKVLKDQLDDMNKSGAGSVGYDNTESGLEATNMQSAIDEVSATAKNALPKSGGTVQTLNVQVVDNGYGSVSKNHSASADYGTQLTDTSKDGKSAKVSVSAALGTVTYTDADNNIHDLHHTGNKPFGNYAGNGSVGTRTIATKGIGRVMLVYCSTHTSFVTPNGAFVIDLENGGFSWIDSAKVHYLNGDLILETSNDAFNASGMTYYYQAL